jgi:hypothetical protein
MKATQRFIFVNENNYKKSSLPSIDSIEKNRVYRNISDRFRQVIGNYWFPKKPSGRAIDVDNFTGAKASLAWNEKKDFPFDIKLGKTYTFSTYKTIPTVVKTTTVTLVADKIFGPYPDCITCWSRYLYGFDPYSQNPTTFDTIFGFEPLKIQDIESSFTIEDSTLSTDTQIQSNVGALTPLSMLLLTDAGLPTTERLRDIGVDLTYLSFGKKLADAISRYTTDIDVSIGAVQVQVPAKLSYTAKLFRDGYFDNQIAIVNDQEQKLDQEVDFQNNADVEFVHNYSAKEYEKFIKEDPLEIGLDELGGETKLANMYEHILNNKLEPTILKLRTELDCFAQNLAIFVRTNKFDSKVIYILAETLPLINKFYPFQEIMPYYSRINFRTQPTGPIAGSVEQTKTDGILLRYLQETTKIDTPKIRLFKQTLGKNLRSRAISYLLEEESRFASIKSWGFYEWILKLGEKVDNSRMFQTPIVEPQATDSIILNNGTLAARMMGAPTEPPDSYYAVSMAALHAKVANITKLYSRSYPQLLKGEVPYKETIAYKVAKYANVSAPLVSSTNQILNTTLYQTLYQEGIITPFGTATPTQEIWFFNSSKEEVINYVDTQIMSDRFYTYVIYSYVLVLESDYYYTNVGNTKPPCEDNVLDFEPASIPLIEKPVPPALETPSLSPMIPVPIDPGYDNTPEVPPLQPVVTIPGSPIRGTTVPGFGQAGREPGDAGAGGGPQGLGPGVGQIG